VNGPDVPKAPRVLHVVVGHGLPTYFLNTVRSVRATAPDDPILAIDNASPEPASLAPLKKLADRDSKISLILRATNELDQNAKVGGLYEAYKLAFEFAISHGFDFLHMLQGDFQMMWWDDELVRKSRDIFVARPMCVNIHMLFLSRDKGLTDNLVTTDIGLTRLKDYGLTDSGLYHLARWQARAMSFDTAEQRHAKRYLQEGLEVICHPWPTDAQIPWPAVIRNGAQRGRELVTGKPFLKPLSPSDISLLKYREGIAWIEDFCMPWGWICLSPMWLSGLDSFDYWVLRYRDAKKNGLRHFLPRLELGGTERKWRFSVIKARLYSPPFLELFVRAPMRELIRRMRQEKST
jgi:hypothetical protein